MPSFYDRRPASRTSAPDLHPSMLTMRAGDLPGCENCGTPVVRKASGTWTHATHGYATCQDGSGNRAKVPENFRAAARG